MENGSKTCTTSGCEDTATHWVTYWQGFKTYDGGEHCWPHARDYGKNHNVRVARRSEITDRGE